MNHQLPANRAIGAIQDRPAKIHELHSPYNNKKYAASQDGVQQMASQKRQLATTDACTLVTNSPSRLAIEVPNSTAMPITYLRGRL